MAYGNFKFIRCFDENVNFATHFNFALIINEILFSFLTTKTVFHIQLMQGLKQRYGKNYVGRR